MYTKLELTIGTEVVDFFEPINTPLLEELTKYLISEYSNENLLFAKAVGEFKEAAPKMTQSQYNEKVLEIYNKYVSEAAPSQINIDDKVRKSVSRKTKSLTKKDINIFDDAFIIVQKVISRDSMKRFIETQGYKNALKRIEPVKKEYDVLSDAYENQPKDKRSEFIFKILKQNISDFETVEKNIAKYSSGNIFVKSHKKLHIAYDKKHDLLIRQQALEALMVNKFHPDAQIELAKQRVKLSQSTLDRAQENLTHVEKGDSLLLKIGTQGVDEAQVVLDEAIKELDKLTDSNELTVKIIPLKRPLLMRELSKEKTKAAPLDDNADSSSRLRKPSR